MAKRTKAASSGVVAYLRVSTAEQADGGLGVAAQRAVIESEMARRGLQVTSWREDLGASGSSMDGRPGLSAALDDVKAGRASALVVAKLDRLSRSLLDFASLMEQSRREGWALIALDLGVDTTTPAGEMVANVMATFAQFERRLIGQRTKEALGAKKAQGVRLGRPRRLTNDVVERITTMRSTGMALNAIADRLTADGVGTAQGGVRWYASTVRGVLNREET
jgi:DNA invertase Pin-like site-specific DNA recombinase